jgi:hypothetical protein
MNHGIMAKIKRKWTKVKNGTGQLYGTQTFLRMRFD